MSSACKSFHAIVHVQIVHVHLLYMHYCSLFILIYFCLSICHKSMRSGGLLMRPLLVVLNDDAGCAGLAGCLGVPSPSSALSSRSLSICDDCWIRSSRRGAGLRWRLFLRRISPLAISTKYDLFWQFLSDDTALRPLIGAHVLKSDMITCLEFW